MKTGEVILPVDPLTGYAFVTSDIHGPRAVYQADLLLDTGAAQTVLSGKLAAVLGYELGSIRRELIPVAGGQALSRLVRLNKIAIGEASLADVNCRFMELPLFDGLLGNDLLRRLNILVVLDVRGRFAKLIFRG